MRARVLGPVDVIDGDANDVPVGGPLQSRLLAVLIAAGPNEVALDDLVNHLWPDDGRPADPVATLRTYVGRLRSTLGQGSIETKSGAYRIGELQTDAGHFEALVERARRASGSPAVGDLWRQAVAQWRGAAFEGHEHIDTVRAEALRLEELRAEATEAWFDARLAAGEGRELAADVETAVGRFPLRDGFRAQQMTVLARAGRQVDALRAFQKYRAVLTDVGLEPSAHLAELDRKIAAGHVPRSGARRTLRGYDLGDLLGSGAFAQVWQATQASVGRDVAIKQIRSELADQPEFIRQFEAEAHLVARLEHPHIVPLYDYWREPGSAYLVMRYLDGGSLAGHVLDGPLPVDELVSVMVEVASALDEAHSRNVIHRDVKPANVLLDRAGRAYLSDFGIAVEEVERLDPEAWLSNGSPAYAAPEQLRREAVGPAADVYSLGVTAYESLTGSLPFPTETTMAGLLERQLNDPIPLVRSSVVDVPAAVDVVIQRATAKNPADRYPSAGDFVRELAAAAGVEGVERLVSHEDRNPYKGLAAFDEADAGDFAGRNRLVSQLISSVRAYRGVAVVGPSGSGKSSVVRAGLIPALRQGAITGSDRWFVTAMVPGSDPFADLENALVRIAVDPPLDLGDTLRSDVNGLARAVRQLVPNGRQLVLVVDQFEELFTLTESELGRRFLDRVVAALEDDDSQLRLIVTLRADFYDQPLRHPSFAGHIRDATVPVLPLAADELERAITEPAAAVGASFESGLVARLTADVADQPGSLPLLQYALTELFDAREGATMTRTAYEALGGISGAIARRADGIYESCSAAEQVAARRMFGRLVSLGEGGVGDTRRRVSRSELATDDVTARVLDRFGDARLLAFDRDAATRDQTIEVGHEALIGEWPRLQTWLDEDRDGLRILHHLTDTADGWENGGRENGELYRGGRLDTASEWAGDHRAALNASEIAFLEASQAQARSETEADRRHLTRLRRSLAAVAVVAAIALIAGGLALVQQRRANQQAALAEAETLRATENETLAERQAAETEEARAAEEALRLESEQATLVATAKAEAGNRPEVALLLAVEAYRRDPGLASEGALLTTLGTVPDRLASFVIGSPQTDRSAGRCNGQFGPGQFVVAGITGVTVFDATSGTLQQTDLQSPCPFAVTSDGRTLAAPQFTGEVQIWDVDSNELVAESSGLGGAATVAFSPAGDLLAVGLGPRPDLGESERLVIVDAATAEVVEEIDIPFPLSDFGWGPNGEFLFISQPATDGAPLIELVIRDGPSGAEIARFDDLFAQVVGWVFSGDGEKLTVADLSLTGQIIDLETGERIILEQLASLDAARSAGTINHDGSRLAVAFADGIRIFDTETGEQDGELLEVSNVVDALSFVDDETMAVVDDGGQAELLAIAGAGGIVQRAVECCWGVSVSAPAVDGSVAAIRNDDSDQFGIVDMVNGTLKRVEYADLEIDRGMLLGPSTASNGMVHLQNRDLTVAVLNLDGEIVDRFEYLPDRNLTVLAATRTNDTTMWLVADLDEPALRPSAPGREQFVITDLESRTWTGVSLPYDPADRPLAWKPIPGDGALIATETELMRYDAEANLVAGPVLLPEGGGLLREVDRETFRWAATSRQDGTIDIWNVETLDLVQTVAGVPNITWIGFVDQGKRLILTDGTGRYLLYDRESATSVGWLLGNQRRVWDGPDQLAPGGDAVWLAADGMFQLVPLDPEVWRDRACALAGRELTDQEWVEFVPGDEPRRDICS